MNKDVEEVRTVLYPEVTVRREVSDHVDEEWTVTFSDGKPDAVRMRTIIYVGSGDPIIKSDYSQFSPAEVPGEVVSEMEKHMVPRGVFA